MTPVRSWQVWPNGEEHDNRVAPLTVQFLTILWRNMNRGSSASFRRALKIEYDNGQTVIVRAKQERPA